MGPSPSDSAFDLHSYFGRIGYQGSTQPDSDTLRGIVAAHGRSIPFENLDPLLGIPVADLSAAALSDKLVTRRRGGYCYEHNGLLGYALDELGYGVERLAGRVVWMKEPDAALPALTHNVLAVTVPGEAGRYLVDVGFGGQTLPSPIRLQAGAVQQTRHEPYRLLELLGGHEPEYELAAQVRGEWQPLYRFATVPQPRIDLEVGSWYVSTHPGGIFVVGLTAALVTDDARINLRGRNLAIHSHGETERIRFDTAAQVLDALIERFGINLDYLDAGLDIEARVAQVLDS
ncbi:MULTISPECIES: arylamine N-acetyltransferase [unclassified Mycolicibacterium]|uniref:arylamine N-acetyltransferase family protein n=1 Tax=unclassified Mycolicibacterium TaxID=2636767 RepID=UPI0012DCA1B3|nr:MULTISPECIES: arylamine N-acetyltransferase [unclassified Mycolicibacterium]MUL82659.1 arylamine N-acetyltransferase [Mycolicibacterium sp. CBMA 329]MUL88994.1 arylamine N-acetyltransferase [Mycolicibacterium sp. CBMA 331]MUL97561.1 arylamine N-acetyltransferase [Mycolicibacterium sp. CBMA 334]MUM27187.1 arylamine N-acetyltransferase [Mycolicibacterium sp. CBMA 295]MUM38510.1 arylamine N-acetyltransferase [Mycolicibacterium sp. CBMA 247]